MGNVPAKENVSGNRSRASTFSGQGTQQGSNVRRNSTNSFGAALLGTGTLSSSERRQKRTEEKDRARRQQALDLIVRYTENVDGGYLAPYGTYKSNLDYNTSIVRTLIVKRMLAPFYTPLQDYDESWSDEELIVLVRQLPLHEMDAAYSGAEEEEDDADNHKLHKSTNYYRRQETKAKIKMLKDSMKELQKIEDQKYLEMKKTDDLDIASDELILKLYKDAIECPICFLYFPKNMNISRCCVQPICSECFVQIKRLDPHPPHDENDPNAVPSSSATAVNATQDGLENSSTSSHVLVSEPACCPYCGMEDFGVTYSPIPEVATGKDGIKPRLWTNRSNSSNIGGSASKQRRKSSVAPDSPGVITIDMIRPDWESKLQAARSKVARKAATASAIHASNLIINEGESSSGANQAANQTNSIEERMIQEALRLSLLDEEERKNKAAKEHKRKGSGANS